MDFGGKKISYIREAGKCDVGELNIL